MTEPDTPSPADKLKAALAAKKAKKAKTGHGFGAQPGAKAEEKAVAARNVALAKPAFRRASKRG
ncbi:hypothetical protein [Brevundimonas sp. SORGH_AS_0993]|uniref:hypothetical protein n=1 Tax=Brevundimonas sp. SORGH_AS_0993 TaxID=3041794 RepID=UPI00278ADEC3|nr:hypothetical protein [Brevundimonas sp. SORGH_AS_0993]MDQ1154875.1 hypothetical protein [Brevundimonas sp. SORGH_AS_0993]